MIIDNFGTIKTNPYRYYVPRVMMATPIVDEIDWSTWPQGPLMVVPDAMVTLHSPKRFGRHVTTDPACARHRPPTTRRQRRRFDRARGIGCPVCMTPTEGSTP